jgi:hypothetical protein
MTTPDEPKTTAQSLLGPGYTQAPPDHDPNAYRKTADPRYTAALSAQKAQTTMAPRRRPILRLVWDKDAEG